MVEYIQNVPGQQLSQQKEAITQQKPPTQFRLGGSATRRVEDKALCLEVSCEDNYAGEKK